MGLVEIFKTNVETGEQAERLVNLIQDSFPEYAVNFDLDDCDRILRIKSTGLIHESSLVTFLQHNGVDAAVLSDEIPSFIGSSVLFSSK